MAYIGREPTNTGEFLLIDDISSNFDGSEVNFTLQVGLLDITPAAANTVIALDGVLQEPTTAYSISGSTITFTEAPDNGLSFYGVLAGQSQYISNSSITDEHISAATSISGSKINTDFGAQNIQITHITASGNISASGIVIADTFQSTGGSVDGISFTDDLNITGNITASGTISASGNLSSTGNLDIDGTSNLQGDVTIQSDLGVVDINASGNITGSEVSSSVGSFTTVDIDGGTITGITDLTVADGGTGVSTLTDGGVLLGSGTSGITAMSVLADSEMIVGDGSTDPVAESGATLRTSIGVGTTDDVKFANITGSSVSASVGEFTTATIDKIGGAINFNNENMTNVDIDSGTITGITDLTVADGGTGVSTLTDGGVLLGSGTDAITAMAVLTDGQMIVGDGSTDPVAESGATLRTSIGVGTTDDVKFANITGSNNISASGNLSITGNVDVDGTSNFAGDVTLQNDLVVTGRIDAEEIHTTFISSSITQATGSNLFGDATSDSHQFTGSVDISGSFTVRDGNVVVSDTLTATNIGAFTAAGAIDFNNENMTNVDIDSGVITGITDLTVADGGTGVSTLTDGGVLLGSGTSAITAMAVLTDGQMIVGDGTTDPVAESGATLRTSIGVGLTDDVVFSEISGSDTTLTGHISASGEISSSSDLGADGNLYVGGDVNLSGHISASGEISSSSNIGMDGNLYIGGDVNLSGHISASGEISSSSDLGTDSDLYVGGRITGSSGATFADNVGIGAPLTLPVGVALDITGSSDQQIRIGAAARAQLQFNGTKTTNAEFAEISFANGGDSVAGIQVYRQEANDQASMQFLTQATGGSVATRMTISGSGNVGIGTTNPTGLIHVNAGSAWNTSEVFPFHFVNLDGNAVDAYGMLVRAGGNDHNTPIFEIQDYGGNTDFRITGRGEVVIGKSVADTTAEAVDLLNVIGDTGDVRIRIRAFNQSPMVDIQYASGSIAVPRPPGKDQELGRINFTSFDGSDYSQSPAKIIIRAPQDHSDNDAPADMEFFVNSGDRLGYQVMNISGSGKLGYGRNTNGHKHMAFYFSGSGISSDGQVGGMLIETQTYGQPVTEIRGTSAQSNDAFGLRVQASNGTAWIQQWNSSDGTERMRINGNGNVFIGNTSNRIAESSGAGATITPTGQLIGVVDQGNPLGLNRLTNDGSLVELRQAGSLEGTISVSGTTVAYNAFLGAHWSELSGSSFPINSGSLPNIKKGTVVSTIDEITSGHGNRLAKFKITDTENDTRVYGVFGNWNYDDDTGETQHASIHSLGAGLVRVTGSCVGGDLLVSAGDGCAKVNNSGTLQTVIGKVTANTSGSATEDRLIPAVFYCG